MPVKKFFDLRNSKCCWCVSRVCVCFCFDSLSLFRFLFLFMSFLLQSGHIASSFLNPYSYPVGAVGGASFENTTKWQSFWQKTMPVDKTYLPLFLWVIPLLQKCSAWRITFQKYLGGLKRKGMLEILSQLYFYTLHQNEEKGMKFIPPGNIFPKPTTSLSSYVFCPL